MMKQVFYLVIILALALVGAIAVPCAPGSITAGDAIRIADHAASPDGVLIQRNAAEVAGLCRRTAGSSSGESCLPTWGAPVWPPRQTECGLYSLALPHGTVLVLLLPIRDGPAV